VGSVSETSERTTMAPQTDLEAADLQLELPEIYADRGGSPGAVLPSLRTTTNTSDVSPEGVQP
jgi:hypothetical protein